MRANARIGDHPIHPMLILLPAGAFVIVLLCDLGYLILGEAMWWEATRPVLLIGIAGAVIAAVPGLMDYLSLAAEHDVRTIGLAHMALNVLAVAVFAFNAIWRWQLTAPPELGLHFGFWLTLVGSVLLGIGGWLGGTMVYKHGMGVVDVPGGRRRSADGDSVRAGEAGRESAAKRPGERTVPR